MTLLLPRLQLVFWHDKVFNIIGLFVVVKASDLRDVTLLAVVLPLILACLFLYESSVGHGSKDTTFLSIMVSLCLLELVFLVFLRLLRSLSSLIGLAGLTLDLDL